LPRSRVTRLENGKLFRGGFPHRGGHPFRGGPSFRGGASSGSFAQQQQNKPSTSTEFGKLRASDTNSKGHQSSSRGGSSIVCHYCKKLGHLMSNCYSRMNDFSKGRNDEKPVQLLSTLQQTPVADMSGVGPTPVVTVTHKEFAVDPRFLRHCSDVTITNNDSTSRRVRLLRDTGSLQLLVCSRVLSEADFEHTGEFRLIKGVTGDVVSVPLVRVNVSSSVCEGSYLCGLVATLPEGIAVIAGNDICSDAPVADVSVVTCSQTAQQRKADNQVTTLESTGSPSFVVITTMLFHTQLIRRSLPLSKTTSWMR